MVFLNVDLNSILVQNQVKMNLANTQPIIWLAPRVSKMNQILHRDWLPEQTRWSYPAQLGLPSVPIVSCRKLVI